MRRFSLPFALAVVLASSLAFAQSDRVVTQFEPLGASSISGEARLNPMHQGGVRIQGKLQGLQPNTEYVSVIFDNATCATGGPSTVVATFTANAAGKANYNELVSQELSSILSISVQLASDPAVLACAAVQ